MAVKRNVPSLSLGSLATSDSETLAVTQTERRSASDEEHVVEVGPLAGDGDLLDDRAVEGSDDPVEGHVFVAGDRIGQVGMVEQVLDILGDAQDAQSLGGVDHGRLGLADPLVGQALLLGGVEADLFDGGLELGLDSLAGVPRHQRGVLAHDVLAAQAGRLLLFVAGDVEFGVGLQECAAVRP